MSDNRVRAKVVLEMVYMPSRWDDNVTLEQLHKSALEDAKRALDTLTHAAIKHNIRLDVIEIGKKLIVTTERE
jgi:hypothetical protein